MSPGERLALATVRMRAAECGVIEAAIELVAAERADTSTYMQHVNLEDAVGDLVRAAQDLTDSGSSFTGSES